MKKREFLRAITPRTKRSMVCHRIDITGHVLPVRAICDMARARGVPVMLDGTHPVPTDLAILDAIDFHERIASHRTQGSAQLVTATVLEQESARPRERHAVHATRRIVHTDTRPSRTYRRDGRASDRERPTASAPGSRTVRRRTRPRAPSSRLVSAASSAASRGCRRRNRCRRSLPAAHPRTRTP